MYTKILVSTDGSKLSDKAVLDAARLAKLSKAELVIVTVREPFVAPRMGGESVPGYMGLEKQMKSAARQEAEDMVAQAATIAAAQKVKARTVVAENYSPYKAIIATAKKEKCDLIVMASHGRSGAAAVLIGSETQKVLTHTTVPVLVLR